MDAHVQARSTEIEEFLKGDNSAHVDEFFGQSPEFEELFDWHVIAYDDMLYRKEVAEEGEYWASLNDADYAAAVESAEASEMEAQARIGYIYLN